MGLVFFGGPTTQFEAVKPANAIFTVCQPAGRVTRTHVTIRNRNGEALGVRAFLPFYLSDSSLARASTVTAALTTGTAAVTGPIFQTTSRGSVELLEPGRAGILGTNTLGRARLNITNASTVNVARFLVILFPDGSRSISSRITLSS